MAKITNQKDTESVKAWVVTVDMGLGHQRAAYPFSGFAEDGIQNIGNEPEEQKQWRNLRRGYEFLSRVRSVPIIGLPLFGMLDRLQNIPPFYPMRNMSNPSYQVRLISSLINKGMGTTIIKKMEEKPLPLLTTYPVPALAADKAGYPLIYCVICDAEISRAWVAENPGTSKIHYLAPCGRAVMRLRSYGVPDERIFLSGFPMPFEIVGNEDLDLLRRDFGQRLHYLDPQNRFWPLHERNVQHFLGRANCVPKKERILTISFAVGGAGAQKEIGGTLVRVFRQMILNGELRLNLIAGIRPEVRDYFEEVKTEYVPDSPNVNVLYRDTKMEYFRDFSGLIRETDILWTKPSELSFYSGLGIPIIIAPTIGSQEEYNKRWLLEIQAGFPQEDPDYADQWLIDLLNEGRLAESAWDGFLKARKFGTYKTLEVLETGTMARETSPLKR
jgi:hypothetical protein